MLLAEGLTDTIFIQDYSQKMNILNEQVVSKINFITLPLENEIKNIDCSIKDCISINEIQNRNEDIKKIKQDNIIVSPNPFFDKINLFINLDKSKLTEINILNMLGEMVFYGEFENGNSIIGLEKLPTGTYIMQFIHNKNIIKTGKIIKQ